MRLISSAHVNIKLLLQLHSTFLHNVINIQQRSLLEAQDMWLMQERNMLYSGLTLTVY
jgi:hypothetical protein